MQLSGSSVLVTGGASGLGVATARLVADTGDCHVVVLDLQDELGEQVAKEIGGAFVHADILEPDAVIRAVDTALAVAPLRAVVNCAGGGSADRTIGRDGEYASAYPLDRFARTVTLNVIGTFNVIRLAATAMFRNEPGPDGDRGAIVNTASCAAFEGQIGQAAYSAGKAAIVGMTLPVARDLSTGGIRVNTIAPGIFATPPMLAVSEPILTSLGASVPFPKRLGQPAEFAALAYHLLTNSYVNGETIRLDGGIRMQPK
jgi:NAD(P)-dependent dehydrogenase (short-subunit alcohol dehydrogenase family)